eukprot:5982636-Pleurochrysis_carterae.AAC.2
MGCAVGPRALRVQPRPASPLRRSSKGCSWELGPAAAADLLLELREGARRACVLDDISASSACERVRGASSRHPFSRVQYAVAHISSACMSDVSKQIYLRRRKQQYGSGGDRNCRSSSLHEYISCMAIMTVDVRIRC